MTHFDTKAVRAKLESDLKEVGKELARHGKSVGDRPNNWTGASDDIAVDSADRNEVADQIEELVSNISIVESLEKQYRDIEFALEKIDNGTYGICDVCGIEIPPERLEANPSARTCIEHTEVL